MKTSYSHSLPSVVDHLPARSFQHRTKRLFRVQCRLIFIKPLIEGKRVAIVANQTSMVGETHLVDKLLSVGIDIRVIFSPEHGFRNLADAGEEIPDGKDPETGISLISLYGNHLKPTPDDLTGIDVVIFDIQDVGTRFYTYISTLHYLLEACAENHSQMPGT